MPRLLSRVLVGLPLVMIFGLPARAAQPSLGEQLLPKTTKGVVLVSNVQQLTKQWEQTQLGKLMDEPEMEPFVKDLRRQFQDRFSRLRERLGVTLDDLRGVPSGELDFAVVQPAKDQAAVALLIDVKGHLPQARELLEKVTANLTAQGGKRTPYEIPGVTLLVFDMPAAGEDPESQVAWFLHEEDSLLGAADNLEVVKDIFQRKAGKGEKGDTLGDVEAFRQVMARCQKHAGPAEPQVRWFVEPLGYMETVRTFTPPERRRKGTTIIDVFRDEGFSAIQGVGGYVDLKVQYNGAAYEILHRTAAHAPGPYAKAPEPYKDITPMDMLTFPNSRDFGLPAFVPNNVAACAVIHWDILKAFDNCAPTFDKLFGENETGIWEDVLESLEKDEDGPQINLRNELIALLEPHVTAVTSYQPEITATSERLLFLVRIKPGNEEKVIAGLRKWLREDDPTIRRRQFEGLDIWESVEPKSPKASAAPTITLPVYTPDKTADTPRKEHRLRRGDDEEQALLPHRSVAVFQGHLLIASHYDYLTEVLTQAKTPDPVSESMDFRLVGARMEAIGADEGCLRSFSRTDEEFRPTYELIRMGKMPEAETMFARMLNAAMGPAKRGKVRKQQIEGKEMPDFQVVRRALGPGGTFGKTEKDGWFVVGFVLEK